MAFIREWVQEKDWELYNSFELYYNNEREEANQNCLWTIDRERNIYFIFLGGGALERPQEYALIWEGRKIWMMVESKSIREQPNDKLRAHWKIEGIRAEKSLEKYQDEMMSLIEEVLDEYDGGGLIVDYMATPVFVEEGRVFV